MGKHFLWLAVLPGLVMGVCLLGQGEKRETVAVFSPAETEPACTAQTAPTQTLSGGLEETDLVCRGLYCYDGPFLEDGSREERTGVTALMLENTGTHGIAYAVVEVVREGELLRFEVSRLPPRATVLVLEKSGAAYTQGAVRECQCIVYIPGSFDYAAGEVRVENDGQNVTVTNLTDRPMSCVRVYYKQHIGDADMYVGGITFSAAAEDLQPGETRILDARYYVPGYALTVAVEVEYG